MNASREQDTHGTSGWLRFEVCERAYVLPLDAIAEVTRATRLHMIPRIPLEVAGIVNFRGEPLPAVDGGAALTGSPQGGLRAPKHLLVLEEGTLRVGLLVEQVTRIDRTAPPERLAEEAGPAQPFVRWLAEGDKKLGDVKPEGLIKKARDLLRESRSPGENIPCPSAF